MVEADDRNTDKNLFTYFQAWEQKGENNQLRVFTMNHFETFDQDIFE